MDCCDFSDKKSYISANFCSFQSLIYCESLSAGCGPLLQAANTPSENNKMHSNPIVVFFIYTISSLLRLFYHRNGNFTKVGIDWVPGSFAVYPQIKNSTSF